MEEIARYRGMQLKTLKKMDEYERKTKLVFEIKPKGRGRWGRKRKICKYMEQISTR